MLFAGLGFCAFGICADVEAAALGVFGIVFDYCFVSLGFVLVVGFGTVDVGFLDEDEGHDLGVAVGCGDCFVECFEGFGVLFEVDVAVAHEGVLSGFYDVGVYGCVFEVVEGFLVFAVVVECDCGVEFGAVAEAWPSLAASL